MNYKLKALGIIALLCFSFYYTHQFALLMRRKDPIYQSIVLASGDKKTQSIDAVIAGDYIIPGLVGQVVNVDKSFQRMKNLGAFLEPYLVYDNISPVVSYSNNKDKIIRQGNNLKQAVAFILDDDSPLISYFEEVNMNYSVAVDLDSVTNVYRGELLNVDKDNYNEVEKILKKKNNNICLVNLLDKDFCQGKKKILVAPTFELNNNNFVLNISKIQAGSIIYLKDLKLNYLKLLIENIVYQNYSIVYLSELISEKR